MGPEEARLTAGYTRARANLYGGLPPQRAVLERPESVESPPEPKVRRRRVIILPHANRWLKLWRKDAPIMLMDILREVAADHGFKVKQIQSDKRYKSLVRARQDYCWRARNRTQKSLPEIGRVINRDHTTVMHAIRAHEKRMRA